MKCPHCSAEIVGLVCLCFEARGDRELFRLTLVRFEAGEVPLYRTAVAPRHLLATHNKGLTFCGAKRYARANTSPVTRPMFEELAEAEVCSGCYAKVTLALGAREAK